MCFAEIESLEVDVVVSVLDFCGMSNWSSPFGLMKDHSDVIEDHLDSLASIIW